MKTIALILLLLPVIILAQVCPNNANEFGILGVEVYGNSAILKNDSRPLQGKTLMNSL